MQEAIDFDRRLAVPEHVAMRELDQELVLLNFSPSATSASTTSAPGSSRSCATRHRSTPASPSSSTSSRSTSRSCDTTSAPWCRRWSTGASLSSSPSEPSRGLAALSRLERRLFPRALLTVVLASVRLRATGLERTQRRMAGPQRRQPPDADERATASTRVVGAVPDACPTPAPASRDPLRCGPCCGARGSTARW